MKPEYRILIPENIPIALKKIPQWVVWRGSLAGGKWTKPPFDPKTGKKASINNPGNWADYEIAFEVYQRGGYDGLGFILTVESNLVAFDFDHCVHDTGIDPEVKGHLDTLKTYTEFSPTDGIRALAFGRKPGDQCKLPSRGYEIYDKGRYVTITGHTVAGSARIEQRQQEIEAVYRAMFPDETTARENPPYSVDMSDQSLLDRAFQSTHGAQIQVLYNGDTSGFPSHSEADLALCNHLAYWTGRDAGRMDAIFRTSGLMRDKWDERHGRATYGQMTIKKAIAGCSKAYEPKDNHRGVGRQTASVKSSKKNGVPGVPVSHKDVKNNNNKDKGPSADGTPSENAGVPGVPGFEMREEGLYSISYTKRKMGGDETIDRIEEFICSPLSILMVSQKVQNNHLPVIISNHVF